jgi:hypothetical protein
MEAPWYLNAASHDDPSTQSEANSISIRIAWQVDEVLDVYQLWAHTLSALFIAIGSSMLGSSKSLQSSN